MGLAGRISDPQEGGGGGLAKCTPSKIQTVYINLIRVIRAR